VEKVRTGIIGVGGMGYSHCKVVNSLEEIELTCVCDNVEEVAKERAEEFGVKYFTDYKELIKSGLCDAVIVATHHWMHSEVAVFAFENGLHVLSEKPIAVRVSDADRMIEASKKNNKIFSVMFQRRTEPVFKKAIEIVKNGILGEIQRTIFIDPWYRAQAYYDSGAWRATWVGEGGGVLINQAPHGIDLFMLLGGFPKRVEAKTRARLHKIEVEDEASVFLEYPNGAWGHYYTTTCESGGTFYMELAGDKGKFTLRGNELSLYTFSQPLSEYTFKAADMWASLGITEEKIDISSTIPTGHIAIIKNFAHSIANGEKLIVMGEEGLKSVEFINAVILSGEKGKPVEMPVDRREYDEFIEELKKTSKPKEHVKVQRTTDPHHSK